MFMKKKVYAVRRGRKPDIYHDWAETERQVKGFSRAEYRSFTYMTEKENDDETVAMSLSHALKQAKEYLKEIPEEAEQSKDLLKWYDEESALNKELDSLSDLRILRKAGLKPDSYGNSPWIAALFHCSSFKKLINGETYTDRYSCISLYTALIYLILDDDKILNEYQSMLDKKQDELPFDSDYKLVKDIWHETEDYKSLKERFETFKMEAADLPEICNRTLLKAKADWQTLALLADPPKSYIAMKKFIRQGRHTVMGLYRELVGNPVYREELLSISGPFQNQDLEKEILAKKWNEPTASMQDIVMQTSDLRMKLEEKVVGQNDVIDKFEESYFHTEKTANAGNQKKGPRKAFLFTGPPGVGKTFIAEITAHALGIPYRRFDMAGYSDQNTVTELIGSSTHWSNSKSGVLTDFVRENPRCVLLFDEIEKACKEVILLFLQILDEGKCFDRHYDRDINFQNTIVFLTTNAGKQLYQDAGNENLTLLPDTVIIDALKKDTHPNSNTPFFPPEIISRMSSHTIIMFNHLRANAIFKIIKTDLDRQQKQLKEIYGYDIEFKKENLAATALYSMGGNMDARNATALAGKLLDRGLYTLLTRAEEKIGLNRIRRISWGHDFSGATDEIRQFHLGEKDCVIAIFGEAEAISDSRLTDNHVKIKTTADLKEFMQIIRRENVILTAVDYAYGMKEEETSLSIADIQTEGSRVFSAVRDECGDIPVYILYGGTGYPYSSRERQALRRRGARGFIHREHIQVEIPEAYMDICCRKTMDTLSLRHQRLTFDLRIETDEKEKSGRIVFCNLKLETAVEAEDKDLLLSADTRPNKHWNDIFVSDDVRKELEYFIDYLKKPKDYIRKGGRIPKGVLMYGPAGTGKTSLAKVVATESGVSFLEIGADMLANKGAEEVHRIFRTARKYAPAVLFLDEVDAIGRDRKEIVSGTNITLNALLTEMDGFKRVDDKPVFVMAATNMEKRRLDDAFLRRFDRTLIIDLPDANGKKWMLERLIGEHKELFQVSDEEINSIVDRSVGMSFADIENMIEAALREAIRADKLINDVLLDDAFEKCTYGDAREISSLERLRRTAYHEAGHALTQMFHNRPPHYMSVVARGEFGGYVQGCIPEDCTKDLLLQRICEMLGGRAAEMVCGYGLTSGASADLEYATALATQMVCRYGMYGDEIGLAVISKEDLHFHEQAKNLINQILSEQLQEATAIIENNRDSLNRLVNAVMESEKKYLTKKEIAAAYNGSDE